MKEDLSMTLVPETPDIDGLDLPESVKQKLRTSSNLEKTFSWRWYMQWSFKRCADELGVLPTTLYAQWRASGLDKVFDDMEAGVRDRDIVDVVGEIALESGRQLLDAVINGEIDGTQLAVVQGIASDKVVKFQQVRGVESTDVLEKVFNMLQDGGKATLTVEPRPPAIDVTAEETD